MAVARRWLITGCARGFGALLAQTALDRGDQVAATDKDGASMASLKGSPEHLLTLEMDVTRPEQIGPAVARVQAAFGGIDLLVNNAGIAYVGPFEELGLDGIRLSFHVNIIGMMAVTQAVLPIMRAQGGGRIINISSDSGLVGFPFQSIYCATKYAVEGFSESISHELLPFGVQVCLVEPTGFFKTALPVEAMAGALARLAPTSPYRPLVEGAAAKAAKSLPEAQDPMDVVRAVLETADAERPPLRRLVGRQKLAQVRRQMADDEQFIQLFRSNL